MCVRLSFFLFPLVVQITVFLIPCKFKGQFSGFLLCKMCIKNFFSWPCVVYFFYIHPACIKNSVFIWFSVCMRFSLSYWPCVYKEQFFCLPLYVWLVDEDNNKSGWAPAKPLSISSLSGPTIPGIQVTAHWQSEAVNIQNIEGKKSGKTMIRCVGLIQTNSQGGEILRKIYSP